jgi:hypothetical protein
VNPINACRYFSSSKKSASQQFIVFQALGKNWLAKLLPDTVDVCALCTIYN